MIEERTKVKIETLAYLFRQTVIQEDGEIDSMTQVEKVLRLMRLRRACN